VKPCFVPACTIYFIAVIIIFHSSWWIVCRISILSCLHNEQFNFPNDFMQLIAFPCQTILTFIILHSSSLVGFTSFLQWCVMWLANKWPLSLTVQNECSLAFGWWVPCFGCCLGFLLQYIDGAHCQKIPTMIIIILLKRYNFIENPIDLNVIIKFELSWPIWK
jgi:hypothetical protein